MYPLKVALLALAALTASPALAADAPAEPPLREAIFTDKAPAYYPEAALQRRASGVALLRCNADTEGRLDDCRLGYEEPKRLDFGTAALKMARDRVITISPKVADGRAIAEANVNVPVRFLAHWEFVTESLHGITPPNEVPSGAATLAMLGGLLPKVADEFVSQSGDAPMHEPVFGRNADRYYPERSQRFGVSGIALLQCTAGDGGVLNHCAAVSVRPVWWWGFNFGALRMAQDRQVKIAPDAAPPGSVVRVPVRFMARKRDMPPAYNAVLSSFADKPVPWP